MRKRNCEFLSRDKIQFVLKRCLQMHNIEHSIEPFGHETMKWWPLPVMSWN